MESGITVKGQATIPKAVRERLGLKAGDRVRFFFHPDGSVVLLPVRPASALRALLKSSNDVVSVEEMNEAVAGGAAERSRRHSR